MKQQQQEEHQPDSGGTPAEPNKFLMDLSKKIRKTNAVPLFSQQESTLSIT
jgi:hypothetical protein